MFEQVIRLAAELGRHTCQAVLDTLDAARPNIDDPIDQAVDDVLWESYLARSEDNFDGLRLASSQPQPQPEYDLDQLFLGPFEDSGMYAAAWRLGNPIPDGIHPAGGWDSTTHRHTDSDSRNLSETQSDEQSSDHYPYPNRVQRP